MFSMGLKKLGYFLRAPTNEPPKKDQKCLVASKADVEVDRYGKGIIKISPKINFY